MKPLKQLLACWLVIDEKDMPLTPRLVGTPGIGKNLARYRGCQNARAGALHLSMYPPDTRPEDLLITPRIGRERQNCVPHFSTWVTAMIRGGICVLDEGNRMNEKIMGQPCTFA